DLQGQGLLLPCTISLYGPGGELLGVAGVELTFAYLIRELLTLDVPGVEEAFLLDGEGRIVVRSSEGGERLAGGQLHEALALAPFPHAPVVEAARTRRAGFVEVPVGGRRRMFTVNPLETIGWSFVTRVAPEAESA